MMKFPLFSTVTISHDLPDFALRRGDVGTVVEYIERPNEEDGYIIELFDVSGNTIEVVPMLESWLEEPRPNTILTFREVEKVA